MHALCGENGAGKATRMKSLYGMQQPDEGTITVNGDQVTFSNPADAIARGIGMKTVEDARELASTMVGLGTDHGVKTVALLTDMS